MFAGRGRRLRFGKHLPACDHPPDGQSVGNVIQRVLVQQHNIRQFAWLQAPQKISRSHPLGTALSRDAQDLNRRDAGPSEILELGMERLAVVVAWIECIGARM
jgi:hypothetical protein